jgi:hypothetical protein
MLSQSFEARLAAVEAKVGKLLPTTSIDEADVDSRLQSLQSKLDAHSNLQLKETWRETQELLRDLDPGVALTHQQQPLLYRRQELLASADTMSCSISELKTILHLLQTSQPAFSGPVREDQVTQAPILTGMSVSLEDERRLDALRLTLQDLQTRTQKLMGRMDHSLECYHSIMTAASEKFVLADEVVSLKENK